MFNFFKKSPEKKLTKQYLKLLKQAQTAQRNGDMKAYSELTEKANSIATEIDSLPSLCDK